MREVIILIKNAVGRELPEMIGTYQVRPFAGIDSDCSSDQPVMSNRRPSTVKPGKKKLQPGLKAAVEASGLKDGMTISFHHSFREGDQVDWPRIERDKRTGDKRALNSCSECSCQY